jgi:plastocyanin
VTTTSLQEALLVPEHPRSPLPETIARAIGGALVLGAGAIHLDLYLTGYRFIPTIGWMFLLQVVAAFALGTAVLVSAAGGAATLTVRGIPAPRLVAGTAGLFALATLGGYLLSLEVGLFGFSEVRTTAGIVAGIVEIAAFLVLGWAATSGLLPRIRGVLLGPLGIVAVALLVAAESTAAVAGGAPAPGGQPSSGSSVAVVIKNFAFHPSVVTARPGETIVVKNEDSVAHTFSTRPGAAAPVAFTTGAIAPGGSRSVEAPVKPGRYPFLCLIHVFMTGTLVVRASG